MENDTNVSLKFTNKINGEAKLKRYVETLKQVNGLVNSLDTSKMNQIKSNANLTKTTSNVKNDMQSIATSSKTISSVKFAVALKSFGSLIKTLSTYTKKSAEYLENWNLLDVAYQNNTESAQKFTNTLADMYGLDESWGYRTIGIFKQLGNAMGLTEQVGNKLAETLTQLAIDTASLYNIDVNDTVSILQSGLAGQTKPVNNSSRNILKDMLKNFVNLCKKGVRIINYTINFKQEMVY